MADPLIFGLLFAAIAIGWLLGRRASRPDRLTGRYFTGGRESQDRAAGKVLETFVAGLAADGGSIETRMALGVQLRKQGEMEGAVRIHQDLLARPGLPAADAARARLELARDFISAGLLDRAEELLLELVREAPAQRRAGQRHLLEIYETERDWHQAIEVARALLPRTLQWHGAAREAPLERGQRAALLLAHYCCELAGEERLGGDLPAARKLLLEALAHDKQCVRASILLGQVEFDEGRYRPAIQALRRVRVQDPDYLPETIEPLRRCYEALGDLSSLRDYLDECLATRPTAALVAAVAEDMIAAESGEAAGRFLAAQLVDHPSLQGLAQLIRVQLGTGSGESRADLALLQELTQNLVARRPTYRCGHCGFAGKHLHWNCPGCKHWGSVKIIDGPGSQ